MTKIVNFFKKYGRWIIEATVIIGFIITIWDSNITRRQFNQEVARRPNLVYSVSSDLPEVDQRLIQEEAERLVNKFYDGLVDYRNSREGVLYDPQQIDYARYIENSLPMSATIPARRYTTSINLQNNSESTANEIRIIIEMDRIIELIEIDSIEPYAIIQGGAGENNAMIEIDRLVSSSQALVHVTSVPDDNVDQLDRLILAPPEPKMLDLTNAQRIENPATPFNNWMVYTLPSLYYDSPSFDTVTILVTSSESEAIQQEPDSLRDDND